MLVVVVMGMGSLNAAGPPAPAQTSSSQSPPAPEKLPTAIVSAQSSELTLPYQEGVDVASRVPSAVRSVTIEMEQWKGFSIAPEAEDSYAEMWTRFSDAVALVQISRKTGAFTAARDWIVSVVDARIIEVLKPAAKGFLSTGQELVSFRAHGGVARLGDVTVTAISTLYDQVEEGRTYLLFLNEAQGRPWAFGGGQLEVVNGSLRSLGVEDDGTAFAGSAEVQFDLIRRARNPPQLWQ